MTTDPRRNTPLWWVVGVVVAGFAVVGVVQLGEAITPGGRSVPSWNPISMVIEFASGRSVWPPAATWLFVVLVVVAAGVTVAVIAGGRKRKKKTAGTAFIRRVNESADVGRIKEKQRQKETSVLHPNGQVTVPGIPVGRSLDADKGWVYQSFRQCGVHVWGPGRGKSYSQVARHALSAPGAYGVTSNKPEPVREVIAARSLSHPDGRVWMFDPDQIFRSGTRPAFTFDILAMVTGSEAAVDLAELFETASQTQDQRGGDPQFDPAGREFLAWCILAAATADDRDIRDVHRWVSRGETAEPARILRDAGYRGPVDALLGLGDQPEETRGGVFGTAQRMGSALVHDHLLAWVTPTPGIPVFDPAAFVTSEDTLVLLSQEKAGPLAAFVSSLLVLIFDAARREAKRHIPERLPVPLVMDLDECGNVVTLTHLPDWFTHFGSKGICISAYFQSPSQGEKLFGREGFAQLWDAAGMRVYGGGVDDAKWLGDLSKLLGTYDKVTVSTSVSSRQVSRSESTHETARVSVSELADLPEWRAVVRTSNGVSAVVETVPIFQDPHFAEVLELAKTIKATA